MSAQLRPEPLRDPGGLFKKGQPAPAKAGRKRGQPNKVTYDIREMIERALTKAGGVNYLARQAHKSPAAFLSLVGRILPQNVAVNGTLNANLTVSVEVRQAMALELLDQLFAGRQAALLEHQPQIALDNAVQSGAGTLAEIVTDAVVEHVQAGDDMTSEDMSSTIEAYTELDQSVSGGTKSDTIPVYQRQCEECSNRLVKAHHLARYCSDWCQRQARAKRYARRRLAGKEVSDGNP